MKAVVAAFNQEKALVGAFPFSVITNLRIAFVSSSNLDGGEEERHGVDEVDGEPLVLGPAHDVVRHGAAAVVHAGGQPLQGHGAPQALHRLGDDAVVEGAGPDPEHHVHRRRGDLRGVQLSSEPTRPLAGPLLGTWREGEQRNVWWRGVTLPPRCRNAETYICLFPRI